MTPPKEGSRRRTIFDLLYEGIPRSDAQIFASLFPDGPDVPLTNIQIELRDMVRSGLLERTGETYSISCAAFDMMEKINNVGEVAKPIVRDIWSQPNKILEHFAAMRAVMVTRR